MNVLEVLKMYLDEVLNGYEDYKFCEAVLKRIKRENVPDEMVRKKIDKFLPLFHFEDSNFMYQRNYVCQEMQFLQ